MAIEFAQGDEDDEDDEDEDEDEDEEDQGEAESANPRRPIYSMLVRPTSKPPANDHSHSRPNHATLGPRRHRPDICLHVC